MSYQLNLSGSWGLRLDQEKAGIEKCYYLEKSSASIFLPGTTAEAGCGIYNEKKETGYLTEYYHFEGYAWFDREVRLPGLRPGQSIWLKLERTRISYVWLDGQFVGSQDSFAASHWYDLTEVLKGSTLAESMPEEVPHRLVVMVSNVDYKVPGGHMTSPDTQTNWNGILGDIILYCYDGLRIAQAQITSSLEQRALDLELILQNAAGAGEAVLRLTCREDSAEASDVFMKERKLFLGEGENRFHLTEELPMDFPIYAWNEFTPKLYQVDIWVEMKRLADGNCDRKSIRIGFRDLHSTKTALYLNELPVLLRGKHDGMVFPLTGYAPMEKSAWRKVFTTAKEYGINHYRFHTCCPPEAAFDAADELGIYLEPEIPFWGTVAAKGESEYDGEKQEFLFEEGLRILKEFGNHPSFLMFSLGNELWGSQEELNYILGKYKAVDKRHWYTQGSNNFQFKPALLDNEDFFCGVRFSGERLFRGSYAMCDAPQGHVQVTEPENVFDYDDAIHPEWRTYGENGEDGTEWDDPIPGIPVISHEIGQYAVFPDFREIERYTGVLGAENLKIFRERFARKGLSHMEEAFFRASGLLAVDCYRRELETAFRSKSLAGFQILDIQDFPGQGTALVGILNAFLESKGLITPKEWRRFCDSRVLLLAFSKYVYEEGESLSYRVLLYNGNPIEMRASDLLVKLEQYVSKQELEESASAQKGTGENQQERHRKSLQLICADRIPVEMQGLTRLKVLHEGKLKLPHIQRPEKLCLSVSAKGSSLGSHYDIYLFPRAEKFIFIPEDLLVTGDIMEVRTALSCGRRVFYLGGSLNEESCIEATYCTDFWNYPMFSSISQSMGNQLPIGTMGLYIKKSHPALAQFPTEEYTTPQWWKILQGAHLAILDGLKIEPIVWMIDNFERNHRLGLIYEARVGNGRLLVCQPSLTGGSPEEVWLYRSLFSYASSPDWAPDQELTQEQLAGLYQ